MLETFVLSLNPCSNGIWSLTLVGLGCRKQLKAGLNPCSNGIWSLTLYKCVLSAEGLGLNPCSNGIWSLTWTCVAWDGDSYGS